MSREPATVSEHFRRYAQWHETNGSALYSVLSGEVAENPRLLSLLATVPPSKARPQLLFAAYRRLFGTPASWAEFRDNIRSREGELRELLIGSYVQVNEPGRCTLLLPALAAFADRPLALIEVGASAGLCLLPDFYEYHYGDDVVMPARAVASAPPRFSCTASGVSPSSGAHPDIAWRRGLDPNPIDPNRASQVAWLESFIWPDPQRPERLERLRAAMAIAREVRPRILRGSLATDLGTLIRQAPLGLNVVVVNICVATYTTPAERRSYVAQLIRSRANWISIEPSHAFPRIARKYARHALGVAPVGLGQRRARGSGGPAGNPGGLGCGMLNQFRRRPAAKDRTDTRERARPAAPVGGDDVDSLMHDPSRDDTHSRLHRRGTRIARVDYGGGIWLAAGYDLVLQVLTDDHTFASRHDLPNGSSHFVGVMAPPTPIRAVPIEVDPPAFRGYRRLLARRFTAQAVADLMPTIQEYSQQCIDARIGTGRIDLFHDLAKLVPAMVTLKLIGLPVCDASDIADAVHRRGDDRFALNAAWARFTQRVFEGIRARRKEPRDDLISHLLNSELDGRPVTETELLEMCFTMVIGGMSTTAKLSLGALTYLAVHPDVRAGIIDGSLDLDLAMEEFLRYYSPVPVLCRTATRDVVLGEREIRQGERLGVGFAAANRDPSVFDDPDLVDLCRQPNGHVAFGQGIHYCIGATLGKAEALVMIRQVLDRIPDYWIDVPAMHRSLTSVASVGSSWGTRLSVGLPAEFRVARVSP